MGLWGGIQQLHQQQWVTHYSLYGLDEEGAQVDIIGAAPAKASRKGLLSTVNAKVFLDIIFYPQRQFGL